MGGEAQGQGSGFNGNCHYCGIPGYRVNECHKKTADLKAKGLGQEAPGCKGGSKGWKGKGSGCQGNSWKEVGGGKYQGKGYDNQRQQQPRGQWGYGNSKGIQGLEKHSGPQVRNWQRLLSAMGTCSHDGMLQDPAEQWIPRVPDIPATPYQQQ
jgi:hypothetical protein